MTIKTKVFLKLSASWLLMLALFASGLPYVGYLAVRNKVLAHHKWTHVTPDDVIHVWAMGLIGKLPGGLNRAIYLANPGGTIYFAGSIAQNTAFNTKSSMKLIGSGRGPADGTGCAATITTTLSSGDLFPFANMTDVYMSDFCVVYVGAGANATIRLNYGQRIVVERLFITGPFARSIELDTSLTSLGSTIWNRFVDIHNNNLAANGIGCLLDSSDATTKTINNNTFWNVTCSGGITGANAAGIKLTNSNFQQIINENVFHCGEASTQNIAGSGTGVLITQGATADTIFIGCNVENNLVGFNKATGNTVTWVGGGIQANGTNVTDAQPAYTAFLGTRIGGVLPNFGVTPIGGGYFDSVGIGGGRPTSIAVDGFLGINGATGYCFAVSAVCNWRVQTGALVPDAAGGSDLGSTAKPVGNLVVNTSVTQNTSNGGQWVQGNASENLTLSTSGTTTDTTANLLPANSVIESVVARVTTTITTATDWKLGDATTAGRFSAANAVMTSGTTTVGTVQADQTGAAGPRQTAAAKVRVTTTGTPGAGAIRITVFYRQFVAPTS